MPLSRRQLMRGAALLGSLGSVSAPLRGLGAARADTPVGGPGTPTLTSADYFNLATVNASSFRATGALHGLKSAESYYQVQGLAFDSGTNEFFIAQAPNPDRPTLKMSLDGRSWTADPYNQHASGDLVISRFSLADARFVDSMYFMGAGHGGQIAIEPGNPRTWLWAEVYPGNPRQVTPTKTSSQVYGSHLARMPYRGGRLMTNTQVVPKRYTPNPYAVARYGPVAGGHEYNAAIDTSTAYAGATGGILVVRYRLAGDPHGAPRHFTAFDLAAARAGDFSTPLASTTEPAEIMSQGGHTEGYATCGQYIYLVATDSSGNAYLYEVDFNGTPGTYVSKTSLPGAGEPESIALYAPLGNPYRLYFLTASRHRPRTFDLFYLDTTA